MSADENFIYGQAAAASELRQDLAESILHRTEAAISQFRVRLEQLNEECSAYLTRVDALRERSTEVIERMSDLDKVLEQLNGLAETIEEESERVEEVRDEMIDLIETATDDLDERLDAAVEELDEMIGGQQEAIQEKLSSIGDTAVERSEALVTAVHELRVRLSAHVRDLMESDLASNLESSAEPFLDGVKAFREKGLSKMKKLTELFEKVEDTSRTLTELVEQAKPVLDLVRQAL